MFWDEAHFLFWLDLMFWMALAYLTIETSSIRKPGSVGPLVTPFRPKKLMLFVKLIFFIDRVNCAVV